MKPYKKLITLILTSALTLALASCGGSDSKDGSAADTAESTEDSKAESSDSVAIDLNAPPIDIDYETDGTAKVTVDGTKFMVGDKELWINGVNTPWNNWNDFGSDKFSYIFWDMHFAELEEAGINASRVWINCNDCVGVILNEDGSFKEVTDKHWQDLDVLFTLAKKHHIYIMATLTSFDHFKDSNNCFKNWRNMITSSDNIDGFVNGYVVPFAERYDSCDYLWSIDFMNEPDWVHENSESGQLSWDDICNYFARGAAAVHEHSDILTTVGFGIIKYNSDNYEGNYGSDEYLSTLSGNGKSYLDFYSTHYYYWEHQWFGYPFDKSPVEFGLDGTKPCVIGEVAANDVSESGVTLDVKYKGCYDNGWNGIMAWTSNGVDACGDLDDIKPAAEAIVSAADEKVHPAG